MSEIISNSGREDSLSVYSAVFMDPKIWSLLSLVQDYNNAPNPNQRTALNDTIFSDFDTMFGESALFTGILHTAIRQGDRWVEVPTAAIENLKIAMVDILDDPLWNGTEDDSRIFFKINVEDSTLGRGDSGILHYVTPQEVMSLEFEDMMSFERAEPWLLYYTPEITAAIKKLAEGTADSLEIDIIKRLSKYYWQLADQFHNNLPMDNFTSKTNQAFQFYANSLIDMDAPGYLVQLDGEVLALNANGECVQKSMQCKAIATDIQLSLSSTTDRSSTIFTPCIDMTLRSPDSAIDGLYASVPPQAIKCFTSVFNIIDT